jgi:hypothetical protein
MATSQSQGGGEPTNKVAILSTSPNPTAHHSTLITTTEAPSIF